MKYLFLSTFVVFVLSSPAAQPPADENHLHEAGTGIICQRSAFVHGYRHGYEDGYHLGNIDINMGRHPRSKSADFHGIPSHYSSKFGSSKSFEAGFQEGLRVGYSDGFVGRKFRAVENLRVISNELSPDPTPADPTNNYFDQGVSAGYNHGFNQAQQGSFLEEQLEFGFAGCGKFHPSRQTDLAAQGSFCDGYRRGYLLGHDDGFMRRPEDSALNARR